MKKLKWLPLVLSGAMVAGCMSLEERLQSNDPEIKRQAEIELVQTSRGAQRTAAIQRLTDEQVIASVAISATGPSTEEGVIAVQKLKNEKTLANVATHAKSLAVAKKAIEGINDQALLVNMGLNAGSPLLIDAILMKCNQEGIVTMATKHQNSKVREKAFNKITDQKIKDDIKKAELAQKKEQERKNFLKVYQPLASKLKDGGGRGRRGRPASGREMSDAIAKLAPMADLIEDKDVIFKILRPFRSDVVGVTDWDVRYKLLSRLPKEELLKFVLAGVDTGIFYDDEKIVLSDAVAAMTIIKDQSTTAKIFLEMQGKLRKCDEPAKSEVLKRLPAFDPATIEEILSKDQKCWYYLSDRVTEDQAYALLVEGKASSANVELECVEKLSQKRVDIKVYNNIKFLASKKALEAKMSSELKDQIKNANANAYSAICQKAKLASKETFELDGFYLGMSYDDMKIIFTHHFPKIKFTREAEDKSIDGKIHARVVYIDGQTTPFCFANAKDNKVTRFYFGKKLLKKWYQFDVQDYAGWALAYGREQKINMQYKPINDKTTVFSADLSTSDNVYFHQEAYQYKNNKKGYRVTYFGEEKDSTIRDGLGGATIKALAAKDFRFVRGDPGTLRIAAEED